MSAILGGRFFGKRRSSTWSTYLAQLVGFESSDYLPGAVSRGRFEPYDAPGALVPWWRRPGAVVPGWRRPGGLVPWWRRPGGLVPAAGDLGARRPGGPATWCPPPSPWWWPGGGLVVPWWPE